MCRNFSDFFKFLYRRKTYTIPQSTNLISRLSEMLQPFTYCCLFFFISIKNLTVSSQLSKIFQREIFHLILLMRRTCCCSYLEMFFSFIGFDSCIMLFYFRCILVTFTYKSYQGQEHKIRNIIYEKKRKENIL